MSKENNIMKKIAGGALAIGLIAVGGAYSISSLYHTEAANAAGNDVPAQTQSAPAAANEAPTSSAKLNADGLPIADITPAQAKQIAFLTPVANPSPAVLKALLEISTFGDDSDANNPRGAYGKQTISDATAKALAAEVKTAGHALALTACAHDNYYADAEGVIWLNNPDTAPRGGEINAIN